MITSAIRESLTSPELKRAIKVLQQGGVIAYPTEHCYGLGCDPDNQHAVRKLLSIKQRSRRQGVLLIAASIPQVSKYAMLDKVPFETEIRSSWPGPFTWLLPARSTVSKWVKGDHPLVAVRVTQHAIAAQLCRVYGKALVSTSANRHKRPALLSAIEVNAAMGQQIDYILPGPVGGDSKPSQIRNGISGQLLRQ